jgi:hypothetical protein
MRIVGIILLVFENFDPTILIDITRPQPFNSVIFMVILSSLHLVSLVLGSTGRLVYLKNTFSARAMQP